MVGFVIYVRSSDNVTSKSSNLTDIIKRLEVEQKGVGSSSISVADSVSDTGELSFNGLQLASGIVTLLFSEGEMGVESQCPSSPSRDRWA